MTQIFNYAQKKQVKTVYKVNTDRSGHQNGAFPRSELVQRLFAVSLRAVAVDTGAGVSLAVQEVLQGICTLLSFNKNQRQRVLPW